MSTTRNPETPVKPEEEGLRPIYRAVMTTGAMHPFRVLLARAGKTPYIMETLTTAPKFVLTGVSENLMRGSASAALQLYATQYVQPKYGFAASMGAATLAGAAVATVFETLQIRKNYGWTSIPGGPPRIRFTPALTALYVLRELGFVSPVFGKKYMTPEQHKATTLASALVTASMFKFITLEVTRDMQKPDIIAPDLRDGIKTTFKQMIQGDVYTHSAFQVPFIKPKNFYQTARNAWRVSCGTNMFSFRLLYLVLYPIFLEVMANQTVTLPAWPGFFNRQKTSQPAAMSPTENFHPEVEPKTASLKN